MARRRNGRRKKIFRRKRHGRRRLFKRRRMGGGNGNSLMRITGSNPVAQRTIVTLKYSLDFSLTAPLTLVPNVHYFRLNDIFQPDNTGATHQPYGRDTYALLYNRYRVWHCRWRVTFNKTSAFDQNVVMATVQPLNNSSVSVTTWAQLNEQPRSVSKPVPACFLSTGAQQGNGDTVTFKGHIGLPFIMGAKAVDYAGDRYQALMGASPVELAYLGVFATKLFGLGEICQCTVTLWYTTELFDPIDLAQS